MNGSGAGFLVAIGVRTAIVLMALTAAVRLSHRRHVGELNLHDLMMVLIMANAVQNAMTKSNGDFAVSVVAGGTLLVLGWFGSSILARRPRAETLFLGAPVVLVLRGELVRRNLRREHVREGDVRMAMRQQGVTELARV